eukprot:3828525-Amphidinium_carterae.2
MALLAGSPWGTPACELRGEAMASWGHGTVRGARRWLTPAAGNVGSMQSTTACLLRLPKALLMSNCRKQGAAHSCCAASRCANIAVGPFEHPAPY